MVAMPPFVREWLKSLSEDQKVEIYEWLVQFEKVDGVVLVQVIAMTMANI